MPAETVVVQAFRPAVSGRPEGLHYFRTISSQAPKAQTRRTLRLPVKVRTTFGNALLAISHQRQPSLFPA